MNYTNLSPSQQTFEGLSADYEKQAELLLPGSADQLQPKSQLADVVDVRLQELGEIGDVRLFTPERYSLYEAIQVILDGKTVLARSEHPDEASGPSGLSSTEILSLSIFSKNLSNSSVASSSKKNIAAEFLPIRMGGTDAEAFEKILLNEAGNNFKDSYFDHADINRFRRKLYKKAITLSYWEYIPGTNITVFEDDAVPNRYHIMERQPGEHESAAAYRQIDIADDQEINPIVTAYRAFSSIDGTNGDHKPVIEMQRPEGEERSFAFLQYHRGRDQAEGEVKGLKDEDLEVDGRIELEFVRGRSVGEIALKFNHHDPITSLQRTDDDIEKGAMGTNFPDATIEAYARRIAAFLLNANPIRPNGEPVKDIHAFVSAVAKPPLSVFSQKLNDQLKKLHDKEVMVHLNSDGCRGYARLEIAS